MQSQNNILKQLTKSLIGKSFGQSIYTTFEAILFYKIFNENLSYVLYYYGIRGILYALINPIGGFLLSKIGTKGNLILGTIFLILIRVVFHFTTLQTNPILVLAGMILLGITITGYQASYWPAYHVIICLFGEKKKTGSTIGAIYLLTNIIAVISPIIGALIIEYMGTMYLFMASIIFILFSLIPLNKMDNHKTRIDLKYGSIMKEVFSVKNRLPFYVEGISGYINGVFWGLYLYIILQSVISIGIIASLVTLITGIIMFYIGKIIDKNKKLRKRFLAFGTALSTIGHLLKGSTLGIIPIFIYDNLQKIGDNIRKVPYDTLTYKNIKVSHRDLIDEMVVIREVAYHSVGGLCMIIIGLMVTYFDNLYIIFIIAAVNSLLHLYILRVKPKN